MAGGTCGLFQLYARDGQWPKAFIAIKAGVAGFSIDDLKVLLRDRIGPQEMIGAMEIRGERPNTPVRKLPTKALVDEDAAKVACMRPPALALLFACS